MHLRKKLPGLCLHDSIMPDAARMKINFRLHPRLDLSMD
jgi:hypothetical protein